MTLTIPAPAKLFADLDAPRIQMAEDDGPALSVTVLGSAATQGSKTPIFNKARQVVGMREDNAKSRPWRQDVRRLMEEARPEGFTLIDEAVVMTLTVYVQRPRGHYGARGLKANAPKFPPSGLDLDKVQRCVGDAAQGIWLVNDSRISRWVSDRRYCGPGEVERTVITCEVRRS